MKLKKLMIVLFSSSVNNGIFKRGGAHYNILENCIKILKSKALKIIIQFIIHHYKQLIFLLLVYNLYNICNFISGSRICEARGQNCLPFGVLAEDLTSGTHICWKETRCGRYSWVPTAQRSRGSGNPRRKRLFYIYIN